MERHTPSPATAAAASAEAPCPAVSDESKSTRGDSVPTSDKKAVPAGGRWKEPLFERSALSTEGTLIDSDAPTPDWSRVAQHIAHGLFFGPVTAARDGDHLRSLGVDRVVTLLLEREDSHPDIAEYLHVSVKDSQEASGPVMAKALPTAVAWIQANIQEGHKVLVHCSSGVSRSGTVVLAYLMASYGVTLAEAWQHVAARRRVLLPNDTFFRLLQRLDCELHGSDEPSLPTDAYQAWQLRAITNVPMTFEEAGDRIRRARGDVSQAYMEALGLA